MEASKESDEGVRGVITGIIMASGFSRRMNREKLMLKVEGISVIERVISAAHSSDLDELLLIYQKEQIREIADKYAIKTVYNEHADKGQSAAVKLGVKSSHPNTDGFMFLVGDQPCLDAQTINKLLSVFREDNDSIVVPLYNGKRGNPVIFPAHLKEDLLTLTGDCGGRLIIDKMMDRVKLVKIEDLVGTDIDTYEEYENFT